MSTKPAKPPATKTKPKPPNADTISGEPAMMPVVMTAQQGLGALRVENETLVAVSRQYPRQEAEVFALALQELDLAPAFAKTAFYVIPYRNEYGGVTMVEGPSIKAAMALARRWGNCTNAARILEEQDDRVIVEGVYVDFQTGLRTLRTVSVPKVHYNRKAGQYLPLRPDRLNLAIQAGMSKAVRNAILASLPAALVTAYFERAKQLSANTGQSKATILQGLQSELVRLGANKDALSVYCQRPEVKGQSQEELIGHLQGILNSIKDGQATVDDVLGPSPKEMPKVVGPVNADELIG